MNLRFPCAIVASGGRRGRRTLDLSFVGVLASSDSESDDNLVGPSSAENHRLGGSSTNKGRFQVCGSRCRQQLRKMPLEPRQAVGAARRQTRTQGVSNSAAVTAGSDRLNLQNIELHLWCWLSLRVKRFWCFVYFGPALIRYSFFMDFARTCYRPKQRLLLCPIFWSFIGLWVKLWHINKCTFPNQILCKSPVLNWWPVLQRGVSSDSIQRAESL